MSYEDVEAVLYSFDLKFSLRGCVCLVEGSHIEAVFYEKCTRTNLEGSPEEYVPLRISMRKKFPLDLAEAANVAFEGRSVQLDVYRRGPYALSVLRHVELTEDDGWKGDYEKVIEECDG